MTRHSIPGPRVRARAAFAALAVAVANATFAAAAEAPRRLLVVAPEAFHAALGDFLAHKARLLPTGWCSLEAALKSESGVDDPEKLKRRLYREWRERGCGYVLLVGDVDVLPVRYMVLDRVTPAAFDYAFYPCDLYYSDLAKADGAFDDWNARKDGFHAGYFGEVRGEKNKRDPVNYDEVDYRPDAAVGRWPVSTAEEVRQVAAKSVALENLVTEKSAVAPRRAAFLAVGGWVDSRGLMNTLAAKFGSDWQVEKRFYADAGTAAVTAPPDAAQVCALWNRGLSLVIHAGHGEPDRWDQSLALRDLDGLTNAASAPVVISAGCSTAYFAPLPPYGAYVDVAGVEHRGTDHGEVFAAPPPPPAPYQRGHFNPTGLGEQLLKRRASGAVAYLGCNTGSQPCALTLVDGFATAVAETPSPRLGDCWATAVRFYFERERLASLTPNDDWYPPSIFFQGMKFMLFGDPSLRLPANRTATADAAGGAEKH